MDVSTYRTITKMNTVLKDPLEVIIITKTEILKTLTLRRAPPLNSKPFCGRLLSPDTAVA